MTAIQVSEGVRDRLAQIATARQKMLGRVVSYSETIEHLLAEHPRQVSCGEAHPGMDIYCLPDGTHPSKCCGTV